MNHIQRNFVTGRIDGLSGLARRHGEAFRRHEARLARAPCPAAHPTAIAVLAPDDAVGPGAR